DDRVGRRVDDHDFRGMADVQAMRRAVDVEIIPAAFVRNSNLLDFPVRPVARCRSRPGYRRKENERDDGDKDRSNPHTTSSDGTVRSAGGMVNDEPEGVRLDVWLDVSCLFKTRSEAQK